MMDRSVQFYTEVRKQIGVAQVTILLDKRDLTRVKTQVLRNAIEVEFPDETKKYKFTLPDDIKLNPKSCQGLQWVNGDGIQMRLQLSTEGSRCGDEGWQMMESSSSIETEIQALRRSDGVMFKCSSCGGCIIKTERLFSRVLPLPSENWREMSSDWCCHGNEHTKSLAETSLSPKESDCFLSELYLSVNPNIVDQSAVLLKESADDKKKSQLSNKIEVLCRRCRNVLGRVSVKGNKEEWSDAEYCYLYKHSICVSTNQNLDGLHLDKHNIFRNYSLETFLANHFVSLSTSQATFKFVVESNDGNKPALLIWLLSSGTTLLCSGSPRGASFQPFYGAECQSTGTVDSGDDNVKCYKIAKILYLHNKEEPFHSALDQWNRDFGVETVRLPKHTCMELLLLLATSTQNTPPSMRTMNGFKVGYLRMSENSNQT